MNFPAFRRFILISCVLMSGSVCSAQVSPATIAPKASSAPDTPAEVSYDPTKDSPRTTATRRDNMRGLIYEVRDPKAAKDAPSLYLFGTLHVGKSSFYPLPDAVEEAYRVSKVLVVEASSATQKDSDAINKLVEYPNGENIEKFISPVLAMRVRAQLTRLRLPVQSTQGVLRLRPVMLGGLLPVIEYQRLGYDMRIGLDQHLIARATKEMKPIKELESPLAQMALLTNIPADLQEAFLENAIVNLEQNRIPEQVTGVVNAWQLGDAKLMQEIYTEGSRGLKRIDELDRILLEKRNDAMLDKLLEYLKSSEGHFVAVGSLHLTGSKGLVEQLKKRKLDVKQL
jgi:uncharacterized protein